MNRIKLPNAVLYNVRAVEQGGHWLYSLGCAMFRCKYCNAVGYLDSPREISPLLAPCPNRAHPPERSPY